MGRGSLRCYFGGEGSGCGFVVLSHYGARDWSCVGIHLEDEDTHLRLSTFAGALDVL